MPAAAALPRPISLLGRARIVFRLGAMIVWLFACLPFYYLAALGAGRNPVPRHFLAGIAWLSGVEIRTMGSRPAPGNLLLANHVSWIDIPALAGLTGTAFVGHDGLASMPLLKWLCAMNDTVFVARHDRATVAEQVSQVRTALRSDDVLAIFPEGTTSDGTGLLPFKSALLSALEPLPQGIAVRPVVLDYGPEAADIAWVGEEHGLHNFLRLLARRRPIELTVWFLPALAGEALANRKTIAASAREAMLPRLPA